MKKQPLIILIMMCMALCSWTMAGSGVRNSNSWSISIGDKELLASWKNNKMGDMTTLDRRKLRPVDTLVVQQYLCGIDGQNALSTVTIKNQHNQIIKRLTNKNAFISFTASMPLTDILNAPNFNSTDVLTVYFTIDSKANKINQTELLGKLRFK